MNDLYLNRKSIDGVKKLKKISFSTLLILEEAERVGVEWEKIAYTGLFKLCYRNQVKYFHAQIPSTTTEFAAFICNNKRISKHILSEAGISVSKGYQIEFNDKKPYRIRVFEALEKPLVVKPVNDQQGTNVFLNIKNKEEYISASRKIYQYYGKKKVEILVEEMFEGEEYRVLATQEKILSVIKRVPANIVGDGHSTIKQLIAQKNLEPIRIKVTTYKSIFLDQVVSNFLKNQNLSLESILPKGKQVFLRPHGPLDISLGGDTIDVTDQIHPSVMAVIEKVMKSIPGLSLAGIDYMTHDIESEQTAENYKIIEVNASPSLDWNEFPIEGPHRKIAYEFLKIIFPELG